jgi:large subunit ribosomal protein L15
MKLNTLSPAEGSVQNNYRRGRGQGSGGGGTATRGHKGAKSRSGYSSKAGFEGGQMPLQRRLPKFGFKNINRVEYRGINLDTLQSLSEKINGGTITFDTLKENGLAGKNDLIKILGRGEVSAKLDVTAHAFTATAKAAIESKGGTATTLA